MQHVRDIQRMVEDGDHNQALTAIDDLLMLGPGNLGALKLKAQVFHQKGFFKEEEAIWYAIIERDSEDIDAIEFLYRRHIEEREHFYFTDNLPQGKRYLANPRSLINMMLMLLIGCVAFLAISGYSRQYLFLANPDVMVIIFGLLVLLPLMGIIATYARALREVLISAKGIQVSTLLRSYRFDWRDFESIHLSHHFQPTGDFGLSLLLFPRDHIDTLPIEIDLSPDHSTIRARTFFVDEIQKYFGDICYSRRDTLDLAKTELRSF